LERNLSLVALFAALIAAFGLIPKLDLSFGVPITAQNLGIMLCGTVLGAKRGALAVLLFLTLVAIGLPLLSGGRGGLGVFASPSIGYLIAWPISAYVSGLVVETWRGGSLGVVAFIAACAGAAVVTVLGVIGMSIMLEKTIWEATKLGAAFIPGDLLKAAVAGAITAALYKARPASVLSRG
jgi:biotin transport system substrate-specific component